MAGEYIDAKDITTYWKQLRAFYEAQSPEFYEITKPEYDQINRSEREDSDNHINQERLGDETDVVDVSFYKYLPYNKIVYRTHIIDIKGNREDHYYVISVNN